MAKMVSFTATPPSTASLLVLLAMPLVTRALSLFWLMEADMVSMLAVVCSTLAACSLAACDSDWAVALTWLAAPVRASAAARTSPSTRVRFSAVVLALSFTWPKSPAYSRAMRWVRLPSANAWSNRATSFKPCSLVLIRPFMPLAKLAKNPVFPAADSRCEKSPWPAARTRESTSFSEANCSVMSSH